jgi:hypothetical protein
MNPHDEERIERQPEPGRWWVPAGVIGMLGLIGLGIALYDQHSTLVSAELEVAALKQEVASARQSNLTSGALLTQRMDTLAMQVNAERMSTETRLNKGLSQAQIAARKQAQTIATTLTRNQEEQHKQFTEALSEVKSSSAEQSAKLTEIGSEVGAVKTQVADARSDIDRTLGDLKRVNGDMGVMSGLIATNSKELSALRALGERDYYEFTLSKTQARQRVGGINLMYKKADAKRNRFTLELTADDKRVEKKDRTINEPVQFYVPSRSRQPLELVVNEVKKDTLVGYLSVPKTQVAAVR